MRKYGFFLKKVKKYLKKQKYQKKVVMLQKITKLFSSPLLLWMNVERCEETGRSYDRKKSKGTFCTQSYRRTAYRWRAHSVV